MGIFAKILNGKKPETRVADYHAAVTENKAAMDKIGTLLVSSDPTEALLEDIRRFGSNPFDFELAQTIIDRSAKWDSEKPIRHRPAAVARPTIEYQNLMRLRPAAVACLQSVAERLQGELDETTQADARRAERLGIVAKPSSESVALAEELTRAKDLAEQIANSKTINEETIRSLVDSVLSK